MIQLEACLWRNSRHSNDFGEFCVGWGVYLVTLSAQGWWAIASRLLMTVLLLKVSGVALQEKDIAERRPGYREYIARTNAFFPRRRRQTSPLNLSKDGLPSERQDQRPLRWRDQQRPEDRGSWSAGEAFEDQCAASDRQNASQWT